MQRASAASGGDFRLGFAGSPQCCLGIQPDKGVQPGFKHLDPLQQVSDEFDG